MLVQPTNPTIRATELVKRWVEQYGDDGILTARLESLPKNPTPDAVDAIFESAKPERGFTNRVERLSECRICSGMFESGVELVFEDSDGYVSPIKICPVCVSRMLKIANPKEGD